METAKMNLTLEMDPWVRTLALLERVSQLTFYQDHIDSESREFIVDAKEPRKRRRKYLRDADHARQVNAKVQILERLTSLTISVSWRDSTCSNYADQTWRLGVARWSGQCALTGQHILLGQSVYKPARCGRMRPANFEEMILESAVINANLVCAEPKR
jgi:hypothetical protein